MALVVKPDEIIQLIVHTSQLKDKREWKKRRLHSTKTFQKWLDNGITHSLIFGSSFKLFTIAESLFHDFVSLCVSGFVIYIFLV